MTKYEALNLIEQYCSHISDSGLPEEVTGLHTRWVGGSDNKAMRWLGFMQGALFLAEVYTLEELKVHSRDKKVTAPKPL